MADGSDHGRCGGLAADRPPDTRAGRAPYAGLIGGSARRRRATSSSGYLEFWAGALGVAWVAQALAFAGTREEPALGMEAFRLIAALDLSLGGRRRRLAVATARLGPRGGRVPAARRRLAAAQPAFRPSGCPVPLTAPGSPVTKSFSR
jgi:hypothetical protein